MVHKNSNCLTSIGGGIWRLQKVNWLSKNKFKTIHKQNKGVFEYHHTEDKSKIIYNPLTHDVQSQRGAGVRPLRVDRLALVLPAWLPTHLVALYSNFWSDQQLEYLRGMAGTE